MELVHVMDCIEAHKAPTESDGLSIPFVAGKRSQQSCFRTIVLLAVSFGLRISEVLGLKWS